MIPLFFYFCHIPPGTIEKLGGIQMKLVTMAISSKDPTKSTYDDKEELKKLGATWSKELKTWKVEIEDTEKELKTFDKWILTKIGERDVSDFNVATPRDVSEGAEASNSADNAEREQTFVLSVKWQEKDDMKVRVKNLGYTPIWDGAGHMWTVKGKRSTIMTELQNYSPREYVAPKEADYIKPDNYHIDCEKLQLPKDFVLLDTETTGTSGTDEVVELGILDKEGNEIYHSMFEPVKQMSFRAAQISGISQARLEGAPKFKDEWPKIKEIINGRPIMAHNIPFDKRLMIQTAQRYGVSRDEAELMFKDCIDSIHIVKRYAGHSMKLCLWAEKLGVIDEQKHRATYDCLMMVQVLDKMSKMSEEEIKKALADEAS